MVSALTAQKAFLNNFEDIVNRRVNIRENIRQYQDTLSYASSKVYSVRENIYMLPSDMNLNIKTGTAGYNNKILVSDSGFSLGKNDMVNSLESHHLTSHKQKQAITHKDLGQSTITHEEEKAALILVITGGLTIGSCFNKQRTVVRRVVYDFTLSVNEQKIFYRILYTVVRKVVCDFTLA